MGGANFCFMSVYKSHNLNKKYQLIFIENRNWVWAQSCGRGRILDPLFILFFVLFQVQEKYLLTAIEKDMSRRSSIWFS